MEPNQANLRRWEWYYLWTLCEPSLTTPSLVLEGLTSAVEFAPDGRLAAAGANTLQFFDPDDLGNPFVIHGTHHTPVTGMAFRPPEYRVLATCGLDGTLKLWNPDESSNPIVLYDLGEDRDKSKDWFFDLSFSPDGRRLAFTSNRDGNFDIYVARSDGSQPHNATVHPAIDNFPTWSPDGRLTFVSNRDGGFDIFVEPASGK